MLQRTGPEVNSVKRRPLKLRPTVRSPGQHLGEAGKMNRTDQRWSPADKETLLPAGHANEDVLSLFLGLLSDLVNGCLKSRVTLHAASIRHQLER